MNKQSCVRMFLKLRNVGANVEWFAVYVIIVTGKMFKLEKHKKYEPQQPRLITTQKMRCLLNINNPVTNLLFHYKAREHYQSLCHCV